MEKSIPFPRYDETKNEQAFVNTTTVRFPAGGNTSLPYKPGFNFPKSGVPTPGPSPTGTTGAGVGFYGGAGIGGPAVAGLAGTATVASVGLVGTLGGVLPTFAPLTVPKIPAVTAATVGTGSGVGIKIAGAGLSVTEGAVLSQALSAAVATGIMTKVTEGGKGCQCPGQTARDGSRCGGRSSFFRAKGARPTCSGVAGSVGENAAKFVQWNEKPGDREKLYSIPFGIEKDIGDRKSVV